MKYEVFINMLFRLPYEKAIELFDNYRDNVGFKDFAQQQRVMDVMMHKSNALRIIKSEVYKEAAVSLLIMSKGNDQWSKSTFENMAGFPMAVWIESIGCLESIDIMNLLSKYCGLFPSSLIETCIINLPENMQLVAIDKYYKYIDKDGVLYLNFYYSVSDKARLKLKAYFPNAIKDDILLELEDLNESELRDKLFLECDRLLKISSDELIDFILLKTNDVITLSKFLKLFREKVDECSDSKFRFLHNRFNHLYNQFLSESYEKYGKYSWDQLELKDAGILTYDEWFKLYKKRFHSFGLEETLKMFDVNGFAFESNKFSVEVILEFLDDVYSDINLPKYINTQTIIAAMNKFVDKCLSKDYSLDEFERLVNNIGKDGKTKLIFDDFIEAIIACGKLLKNSVINDKHPLFLELRNKFTVDLINRCEKDGTYLKDISLNGLFYRLAKGSIPFDIVYMIKTYKGLIYLLKCGRIIDKVDYITRYLTDEQVAKLNIMPSVKWCDSVKRANTNADSELFMERMGLQLLCYFGREKGKYLLESDMLGNKMESLFDSLNYKDISVNEDGSPNVKEELLNFLFGRGMLKENNSIINRMIREEIMIGFVNNFTKFCNSYDDVKSACHGVLSLKRIVRYFENKKLPIELKPDEVEFRRALCEINTNDTVLLQEAIELCKDARNRKYSTIPKVEGELGDFRYEILDLGNPLAVAVGNLSHCCFVVGGISYSALKHSMRSVNGRSFVVYHKGNFLASSWVWRNGNVICFDSVEAGYSSHGLVNDDIKLVDVYKLVAEQVLSISQSQEDEVQRVKLVTVGKSDYVFGNLKKFDGNVPRPLESDVYVYDSSVQYILGGNQEKELRYGEVDVKYKDARKKVKIINNVNNMNVDDVDEILLQINSLRYRINGLESLLSLDNYYKVILGDGFYILFNKDGIAEQGVDEMDEDAVCEFLVYTDKNIGDRIVHTRKLKPTLGIKR